MVPVISVVHVHTSHELVQSSVHTSKHESFTFIVHHLNSELVHSSVHFHFGNGGSDVLAESASLFSLSLAIFILRPRAIALEYVACLIYMCVRLFMGNVGRSRVSWFRYRRNYTDCYRGEIGRASCRERIEM